MIGTGDIDVFLGLDVGKDMGRPVTHLPGPTMRRIAGLYPSEAKTDASSSWAPSARRSPGRSPPR
ncbi:hypothetical protein ACFY4H_22565 [Streptomyces althioticus]|uniref:hypothetical protein n=1 Tax=Streptomyces althioticus TaxID=83380 RepID=UPI0036BF1416